MDAQKQRHKFLAAHGINAKDQAVAVFTIQQLQNVVISRMDEAMLHYLRCWIPAIREVLPSEMQGWLQHNGYIFQPVSHETDPLTRKNKDIYCLYRDEPLVKRAFEICTQVNPTFGKEGLFRLDVDHKEIPFPESVKIIKQ